MRQYDQGKAALQHIIRPKSTIIAQPTTTIIAQSKSTILSNQFAQNHFHKLAPRQDEAYLTSVRDRSIATLGPCSARTELPQQRRRLNTAVTAVTNIEEAANDVVLLFKEGCKDGVQSVDSRRNREGDGLLSPVPCAEIQHPRSALQTCSTQYSQKTLAAQEHHRLRRALPSDRTTIGSKLASEGHDQDQRNIHSEILQHVYSLAVSPHVQALRAYTNGTSEVYGELKPKFCRRVFQDINLKKVHVFLDLGSGVGNVVLQAALEVGCRACGIEYKDGPAKIAEKHNEVFQDSCLHWGITPGKVQLFRGDFLTSTYRGIIAEADFVLVNNRAFQPDTNVRLWEILVNLRQDRVIVSLESFIPTSRTKTTFVKTIVLDSHTMEIVTEQKEYPCDSVSWTHTAGAYYVTTLRMQ